MSSDDFSRFGLPVHYNNIKIVHLKLQRRQISIDIDVYIYLYLRLQKSQNEIEITIGLIVTCARPKSNIYTCSPKTLFMAFRQRLLFCGLIKRLITVFVHKFRIMIAQYYMYFLKNCFKVILFITFNMRSVFMKKIK